MTLNGAASVFNIGGASMRVGDHATGAFNVVDGATFTGATINVAEKAGSTGEININNAKLTATVVNVGGGASAGGSGSISVTNSGKFMATSALNLFSSGSFTISGAGGVAMAIVEGATANDGAITITGASNSLYGGLEINGAVTGSGSLALDQYSLAVLGSAVASSQSILFDGAGAQLKLKDPAGFAAPISGFASNDLIDLMSIPYNTGSWAEFVSGALIVNPTTGVAVQLNFTNLSSTSFVLSKDTADGGTDIATASSGVDVVPFNAAQVTIGMGPDGSVSVTTPTGSDTLIDFKTIDLNDATITIDGNLATQIDNNGTHVYYIGAGPLVTLTNSNASFILSGGAQAKVTGGGDTIDLSGSGDVASLYSTGGNWDAVAGSNGTVNLNSAQATITGGGDAISFAGGSGNVASLCNTGGAWDTVTGSNGTVYLTSAQASVTGGGDWIDFAGGSGNAAGGDSAVLFSCTAESAADRRPSGIDTLFDARSLELLQGSPGCSSDRPGVALPPARQRGRRCCWAHSPPACCWPAARSPRGRDRGTGDAAERSYDPTRELYKAVNKAFAKHWKARPARN